MALEKIHRHRATQTKANAERLEEKREKQQQEKPKCEDAVVLTLREQLEEKRRERMKAKEESTIVASRESNARLKALNREKQRQHDERWKDLELGREKTTKEVRAKGQEDTKPEMSYAQLIFASGC